MKFDKILLIGSNLKSCEVGSMFVRACENLKIKVIVCNINHESYATSMKSIFGKAFYKLNSGRPLEWNNFNKIIFDKIKTFNPSLVLVTGIFPLKNYLFQSLQRLLLLFTMSFTILQ